MSPPPPILCQSKIDADLFLTSRQKEVAGCMALDLSRVQIAERLHISPKTVDHHTANIYRELGIGGWGRGQGQNVQTSFILLAFKRGWLRARPVRPARTGDPASDPAA